jgi:hypothetical protein
MHCCYRTCFREVAGSSLRDSYIRCVNLCQEVFLYVKAKGASIFHIALADSRDIEPTSVDEFASAGGNPSRRKAKQHPISRVTGH